MTRLLQALLPRIHPSYFNGGYSMKTVTGICVFLFLFGLVSPLNAVPSDIVVKIIQSQTELIKTINESKVFCLQFQIQMLKKNVLPVKQETDQLIAEVLEIFEILQQREFSPERQEDIAILKLLPIRLQMAIDDIMKPTVEVAPVPVPVWSTPKI